MLIPSDSFFERFKLVKEERRDTAHGVKETVAIYKDTYAEEEENAYMVRTSSNDYMGYSLEGAERTLKSMLKNGGG